MTKGLWFSGARTTTIIVTLLSGPSGAVDLQASCEQLKKDSSGPTTTRSNKRFRDCDNASCPWLVEVGAGRFVMGSPTTEPGHQSIEGPTRVVDIQYGFAVTATEVTVGQFRAFVASSSFRPGSGCHIWDGNRWIFQTDRNWSSPGFAQTEEFPVVCVSWHDARAYAIWLSEATGQHYRLLTEAEWEYAARAGSNGSHVSGREGNELCKYANVADLAASSVVGRTKFQCNDGHAYTAPVGSFLPNAWGLYDVQGNAWEWVEDCLGSSAYVGRPQNGSAFTPPGCHRRVLRGGAWNSGAVEVRLAYRDHAVATDRSANSGIRLARGCSH